MSIQEVNRIKNHYPPGTRIELIAMNDPYDPVPSGTRGTVDHVDDEGQMHMKWDNGRTLAAVPGVDSFRKLTPEEIEAENQSEDISEDNPISMLCQGTLRSAFPYPLFGSWWGEIRKFA